MRGIAESVRCGDIRRQSKQNQSIASFCRDGTIHTPWGYWRHIKKQRVFEGELANENLFHVRHAECQGWIGPLCGIIQTEFATDGHGGSVFFPEFSGVFALSVPCDSTGPVVSGTVIIPSLAHGSSRRITLLREFFCRWHFITSPTRKRGLHVPRMPSPRLRIGLVFRGKNRI